MALSLLHFYFCCCSLAKRSLSLTLCAAIFMFYMSSVSSCLWHSERIFFCTRSSPILHILCRIQQNRTFYTRYERMLDIRLAQSMEQDTVAPSGVCMCMCLILSPLCLFIHFLNNVGAHAKQQKKTKTQPTSTQREKKPLTIADNGLCILCCGIFVLSLSLSSVLVYLCGKCSRAIHM